MSPSASISDLACLRALVRGSGCAVGLLALSTRTFLELSPAATSLTGLPSGDDEPVDIGVLAADHGLVVSLRVVARDGDQPYAIALFGSSEIEEPLADISTIETLLAPLRELGDTRWSRSRPRTVPGLEDLTDRQQEILTRLLDGDRVTTISRRMHLSASTIRNHLATLYRKVGVHSQAELIERLHERSDIPSMNS